METSSEKENKKVQTDKQFKDNKVREGQKDNSIYDEKDSSAFDDKSEKENKNQAPYNSEDNKGKNNS